MNTDGDALGIRSADPNLWSDGTVTFALQLLIPMLEEVVAIPEPEASERFPSFVLISHFYDFPPLVFQFDYAES